jgi:hypothetical protein
MPSSRHPGLALLVRARDGRWMLPTYQKLHDRRAASSERLADVLSAAHLGLLGRLLAPLAGGVGPVHVREHAGRGLSRLRQLQRAFEAQGARTTVAPSGDVSRVIT